MCEERPYLLPNGGWYPPDWEGRKRPAPVIESAQEPYGGLEEVWLGMLTSDKYYRREAAVRNIGERTEKELPKDHERMLGLVVERLQDDHGLVRLQALVAVAILAKKGVGAHRFCVAAVGKLALDQEWEVRRQVPKTLAAIATRGDSEALSALPVLLDDIIPEVRQEACKAVGEVAKTNGEDKMMIAALFKNLKYEADAETQKITNMPGFRVRESAAYSLSQISKPGDEEVIAALSPICVRDAEIAARFAALISIIHLAKGTGSEAAKKAIKPRLRDCATYVRDEAVLGMKAIEVQ